MSIKAMEMALEALHEAVAFREGGLRKAIEAVDALRTSIRQAEAQQPDNAACKSVQKRLEAQQPATTEPVGWVSKTGHGTYFRESITPELASLEHGGRKMWRPLTYADNHPAPGVPADMLRDVIAAVREQYRGTDWGKYAECICDAIDAAMLAAK